MVRGLYSVVFSHMQMRDRRATRIALLFTALILLTTCQLQFNKSNGNSLDLQVVVPGGASGGGKGAPGSKSLSNGTTLALTITPQPGTSGSPQTFSQSIGGKTTVDFSLSLSFGSYQVLAQMIDASGTITLAQAQTNLTVPSGNYPVVLPMYSSLLFNVVWANSRTPTPDTIITGIIPSPFTDNIIADCNASWPPMSLALTTVDPGATITSVTETYYSSAEDQFVTVVDSHTGTTYALVWTASIALGNDVVTILVTGQNGSTATYTLTINTGCG